MLLFLDIFVPDGHGLASRAVCAGKAEPADPGDVGAEVHDLDRRVGRRRVVARARLGQRE